ncbi:MAG TPA: hypothetical protein PLO54_05935 [Bacilli bacterium]|nr:hypothetical protein [Bacilli bacterium]
MKAKELLEFLECIGEPVFLPDSVRERRKALRRIVKDVEKTYWSGIYYRVYYDKPTEQFYAVEKRHWLNPIKRGERVILVYGKAYDFYVEWSGLGRDKNGVFVKNAEKVLGRRVYV